MKKKSVLVIAITIMLLSILALTFFACTEKEETEEDVVVKSITVIDSPNSPYYIGDPNIILSEVILKVVYSDKTERIVPLSDEMLSGKDRRKFTEKKGTFTVEINFDGGKGYYQFEVTEWKKEGTYLASFYSTGGTEFSSVPGKVLTAFSVPEKEGYTFDGWYADAVLDDSGNVQSWGARAVEPYTLSANTSFYAKWIDNRVCSVKFYDYDNSVIYDEEVHFGERIDVNSYAYPDELVTPGKTFLNWNVTNGSADNVEVDLIIKANFSIEKCIVKVIYANSSGETVNVERTFDYGTEFNVGEGTIYIKPEKEGHTSRFVVYTNHAEDNIPEEGEENPYTELPEDGSVCLTEPYTTISPLYTILKYKVIIYNGKETQTKENLKNGTLELERIYENQAISRDFTVDWNTGFDFAEHTQEPDIELPKAFADENGTVGYSGQWCFVSSTADGKEILYNGAGYIWNEDEQIFEEPSVRPEGETDSEWILRNADDSYIATIVSGKLTKIKSNVQVKALYTKKSYDVKLIRLVGSTQKTLVTFKVKYLADINIYDCVSYPNCPSVDGATGTMYPEKDITGYTINDDSLKSKAQKSIYNPNLSSTDIEKLYLKENTDLLVKRQAELGGYYLTNEIVEENKQEEDWTVEWFTAVSLTSGKIDFKNGETLEIGENRTIYCKDTDNRKYEVLFFYEYDFVNGVYNQSAVTPVRGQDFYAEKEEIVPPITSEQRECTLNSVVLPYTFIGWYDTPYQLYLKTGYRGRELTTFTNRTTSVYYYAHYECKKTISVKINDKTQSTAYIGKSGYESCSVYEGTMEYVLPAGTIFDMEIMAYKGKSDGTSVKTTGQFYYDNHKKNVFYNENYSDSFGSVGLGKYLTDKFGETPKEELNKVLSVLKAYILDYKKAVESIYTHDYSGYSLGENSEYAYYLEDFDNALSINKITDFVTEYNKLSQKGNKITSILNSAGYNQTTMAKFGDLDDFITYFNRFLSSLYEMGYENKHTGFLAISKDNSSYENIKNSFSSYKKIISACFIIEEYIDFIDDWENYQELEVTPRYSDSIMDLNNAHGYNGTTDIKYSFSGWFKNSRYTLSMQSDFSPFSFVLEDNVELYAKWTDITRGTEGLMYEEVQTDDGYKYVLIGFVNNAQWNLIKDGIKEKIKSKYTAQQLIDNQKAIDSEIEEAISRYYVTSNDTGAVPESIANGTLNSELEIQIPASLTTYLDYTQEAISKQRTWAEDFDEYLVKQDNSYVIAPKVFDSKIKYYKPADYDVIGIKEGAFDNYSKYISRVTIPLNLYFVEEGAFRYCNILSFTRTPAKEGESEYNYVIVDNDGRGIYQKTDLVYTNVVGRESNYFYGDVKGKTIVAYALDSDVNTTYSLLDGTEIIGRYTFANAVNLKYIRETTDVKEIHDNAFHGASKISTFGGIDGKVYFNSIVTEIGEYAFANCSAIKTVEIQSGSLLNYVGKSAFYRTAWYEGNTHRGIIALRFSDENDLETGIILGYYNIGTISDYNQNTRYNLDGTENANGDYYGINQDGILLLIDNNENRVNVIVQFEVKYIAEGAFEGLDSFRYSFKSIRKIGDMAFKGCAQLISIDIEKAFNEQATVLGKDIFDGRGTKFDMNFPSTNVKDTVTNDTSWSNYLEVINYD